MFFSRGGRPLAETVGDLSFAIPARTHNQFGYRRRDNPRGPLSKIASGQGSESRLDGTLGCLCSLYTYTTWRANLFQMCTLSHFKGLFRVKVHIKKYILVIPIQMFSFLQLVYLKLLLIEVAFCCWRGIPILKEGHLAYGLLIL